MIYRRLGKSGLKVPAISIGLYHNFGDVNDYQHSKDIVLKAFNRGITHFDLANNYGPPPGSAEKNFGRLMKDELTAHRDQMLISTKAGYQMWDGPYGDGGSRKYLLSSLDQSLKRMNLDYVDIFYSHRYDAETPLEETAYALDSAVRQGKALYIGLSNYSGETTRRMADIFKEMRTPFVVNQPKYSLMERSPENSLFPVLQEKGLGSIVFQPLNQGLLTERYLARIPERSRVTNPAASLTEKDVTHEYLKQVRELKDLADKRGQSVAQLAISWVLRRQEVSSALIGVSNTQQLEENIEAIHMNSFEECEITALKQIFNR
ncbi:aldo/keto reductase [Jeotgalibacillus terrae]|uniref:Aldo/keto reductase n=1 Tax=Jeotgalibacillus terrae TaxID=587735 RepID=A0ABW5ZIG6_9BACL|nr:aldo/keto reductase [Jeotgalibacillus terrae]